MSIMKTLKTAPALGAASMALMLTACAGSGPTSVKPVEQTTQTPQVEPVKQATNPTVAQPTVAEPTDKAAVSVLWNKAENARKSGDIDGAYAQLEQAAKIQPKSPVLWSRMAELKLKQRQYVSAENIAAKSNQLVAGRNKVLEYRNWLIIAKAREANGNYAGAAQASERAKALRP